MFEKQGIEGSAITRGIYLIAFLWFYAAISKMIGFQHFHTAMQKQPFSGLLQTLLIYILPAAELLIGAGLLTNKFRHFSLFISALLFLLFTAYIGLILLKAFGHIPCSCGGLIEHMGWKFHLWFNIFFLALNLSIIITKKRKERLGKE